MRNIERAKQLQRTLWAASGWQWTEKDFDERWIHKPYGADWDSWYKNNLVPVNFCALCGDDNLDSNPLKRGYFASNHSSYAVRIYLCDSCYAAKTGKDISAPEEQFAASPSAPIFGSIMLRHIIFLGLSIFVWYIFLPKEFINLVPIVFVCLPIWFGAWLGSIYSIPMVSSSRSSLAMFPFVPRILWPFLKVIPLLIYLTVPLLLAGLIYGFYLSWRAGIVTVIAALVCFMAYTNHWRKLQIRRGAIGT
jgi:hypothetical protein